MRSSDGCQGASSFSSLRNLELNFFAKIKSVYAVCCIVSSWTDSEREEKRHRISKMSWGEKISNTFLSLSSMIWVIGVISIFVQGQRAYFFLALAKVICLSSCQRMPLPISPIVFA